MDLRDYEQHKFAIAEVLRSAARTVSSDEREWHERAQDLFARLAEDRFNLVVVGRFNRGKTSLMNAIMGTDRLPTGIVPLTSVITTVSYGSKEQVLLSYEGRILTQEIPIGALPRYVTQEGNPGNVQHIKKAEVQLPAEILRRGFFFVDTPGLASAIAENTRTTEAFLPDADAFLLVTSYESPLSDEELRFFRTASSSARRIFVVLNKHDIASPEERSTALAYVREQLTSVFDQQERRVFSVSARDGLEAKRSKDSVRLDGSGLCALENELVEFLLKEKSTEFLLGVCNRVATLLRGMASSPEATALIEQVRALAQWIGQGERRMRPRIKPRSSASAGAETMQPLRPCEICAHVNQALWDFLCKFQYDLGVDHKEQQRFAERGGLCSFHSWQYEAIASPLGTCTGFPPLLDRLAQQLRSLAQAAHSEYASAVIRDLASRSSGCVLCAVHVNAENDAISAVANRLSKDTRSLNALSAICLPHLAMMTAALEDMGLVRKLIEREALLLERLSEDMKRYALKRDAARRYLLSDEETAAAHQALLLLSGHRNVQMTGHDRAARAVPGTAPASEPASAGNLQLLEADPP